MDRGPGDRVSSETVDVAVIGGGIVGCATARALALRGFSAAVLEAEEDLAAHQTGHNSGVLHSGLYYRPGSLKARLCVEGRRALEDFAQRRGIAHRRCGKMIVATTPAEVARLVDLEARGRANGLTGLRRLPVEEMREIEPAVGGLAGLFVPETRVVDFQEVTRALADEVRGAGGAIRTGARVQAVQVASDSLVLGTSAGPVSARFAVNCAGLQSDRVARLFGVRAGIRIVPFLGQYWDLRPDRRDLVRGLIYPVPDPRFPFQGVHFTRGVQGNVHAGPNALVAWDRGTYRAGAFRWADARETLGWPGFWRLAMRYLGTGMAEWLRSRWGWLRMLAMRRLLPSLEPEDLIAGVPGIRAQAVARDGSLVDDFALVDGPRSLHVLNAPSPAATASLAIGRVLADRVVQSFGDS